MIEQDQSVENILTQNRIQNKYTFWYRCSGAEKAQKISYNDSIKLIADFETVEQFWQIYDHLKRPNDFKVSTEYHLFKQGIFPIWEDPGNSHGGKWTIRLKKGIASRYWEEILLAIIGEQFDVGPEICGAVISMRNNEDILSVWNKTAENSEAVNKIRDQMRRILELPSLISVEYKKHSDSLNVAWRGSKTTDPHHEKSQQQSSGPHKVTSNSHSNTHTINSRFQSHHEPKARDITSNDHHHPTQHRPKWKATIEVDDGNTGKDHVKDAHTFKSPRTENAWGTPNTSSTSAHSRSYFGNTNNSHTIGNSNNTNNREEKNTSHSNHSSSGWQRGVKGPNEEESTSGYVAPLYKKTTNSVNVSGPSSSVAQVNNPTTHATDGIKRSKYTIPTSNTLSSNKPHNNNSNGSGIIAAPQPDVWTRGGASTRIAAAVAANEN